MTTQVILKLSVSLALLPLSYPHKNTCISGPAIKLHGKPPHPCDRLPSHIPVLMMGMVQNTLLMVPQMQSRAGVNRDSWYLASKYKHPIPVIPQLQLYSGNAVSKDMKNMIRPSEYITLAFSFKLHLLPTKRNFVFNIFKIITSAFCSLLIITHCNITNISSFHWNLNSNYFLLLSTHMLLKAASIAQSQVSPLGFSVRESKMILYRAKLVFPIYCNLIRWKFLTRCDSTCL